MEINALLDAMRRTAAVKPVAVENVPEWGTIYVRPQTVEEVDALSDEKEPEGATKKRRLARGAARIICDENGTRILDATNEEHLRLLEQQPWSILQRILAAVDLNAEGESKNGKRVASS